jgi:hypothetical protein
MTTCAILVAALRTAITRAGVDFPDIPATAPDDDF